MDDAPEVRALLRHRLPFEDGFELVGEASDGTTAIEEAARLLPDVVILDVVMPVLDGFSALPGIRAAAPDAAVIAFTASDDHIADARRRGADSAVLKTAPFDELLATMRRVTRRTAAAAGAGAPR